MNQNLIRPCTWVYFILVGLTLATWLVGKLELSGLQFAFLVLAGALFKGQMIGDFFMGLRQVSGIWRWVIFIWLLMVGSLITTAFLSSTP